MMGLFCLVVTIGLAGLGTLVLGLHIEDGRFR